MMVIALLNFQQLWLLTGDLHKIRDTKENSLTEYHGEQVGHFVLLF